MDGSSAFLPCPPLLRASPRPASAGRRHTPCCSTRPTPPSRRQFLRRIAYAAAALMLSDRRALAETGLDAEIAASAPQPRARGKPRKPTWGYDNDNGPEVWGSLQEEWAVCDSGTQQSPIELSYREAAVQSVGRPTLETSPGKVAVRMREVNSSAANKSLLIEPYIPPPPPLVGDAPPVDFYSPPEPLAIVTIPEVGRYAFRSCHFHVGSSEHVVEGKKGDMEIHFSFEKLARYRARAKPPPPADQASAEVTPPPSETVVPRAGADAAPAPQAIVLAMLCNQSNTSELWLQELFQNFPLKQSEIESRPGGIVMDLDFTDVLPDFTRTSFFSYDGSLTTPPGTEGIRWLVLGERSNVAKQDMQALLDVQSGPNVRPLQPLNQRKVFRFPPIASPDE